MKHIKTRIFVGLVSSLAWIFFLVISGVLKTRVLFLYLGIPAIFIWTAFGTAFGLTVSLITCLFLLLRFKAAIYIPSLVFVGITSITGYVLKRIFENNVRNLGINEERVDEDSNLLYADIEFEEKDNRRMKSSIERTASLQYIVEDYSHTLSEDDILDSIIENSFKLFKNANRVLIYLVDTEKQELKLVHSKKRGIPFPIKAKKGDIFDRWVLKHRMPLLIEDIHKDFRFSLKEEIDEGFNSLISTPLTTEHKILGILRIDSKEKSAFTQSDIRFLDIIADLSSVSLHNAILYKSVENLAIHDSLTGLYVHKYFIEILKDETRRSLRNNIALSLLMIDLDDFKAYNDKYGHNAGDLILKHISSILKAFAKTSGDIVARYGGEEFVLLLLNRNKSEAQKIAEEIRCEIDKTPLILRREKTNVTVSIGVASCPSETKEAREFLMLADSRLYRAKENGKNRVWTE